MSYVPFDSWKAQGRNMVQNLKFRTANAASAMDIDRESETPPEWFRWSIVAGWAAAVAVVLWLTGMV